MTDVLTGQAPHLGYWRAALDGAQPAIDIPAAAPVGQHSAPTSPVPAPPTREPVPADPLSLAVLDGTAGLLAAWAALLFRVSGQQDLVIGTAGGRPATLLPVRLKISDDMTFVQLTAATRDAVAAASKHADIPFATLAGLLGPGGTGSVIQAWLADADAPPPPGDAPFPLCLVTAQRGGAEGLFIEYDGAVFARPTAARLARQLARLIGALAADPDGPVTGPDLLGPDERELVLDAANGAALAVEDGILAHHWFERQAATAPNAIAVECGGELVTYAALDRRAEAVARVLAGAGAGDGAFVGIAVRRSAAMLAAVLGALKAGATYVPLDLSHPAERIAMILEDTGAPLILTDAASRKHLPPTGARPIELDDLPDRPTDGFRSAGPPAETTRSPVAYVTYTSGSTGRPKGILMPHRAVSNLVAWQLDQYRPWRPGYRTLQFASLSFDVSFQEIFSTFASGGTLVLISEAERRDLYGLVRLLNRERIQRLFIPSVALQQVAEGYRADGELPSTLETVIAGSEQLMITDDLREMFSHLPQCRLHNEYGPSETHVTTAYPLPPDPAAWPARAPIGRPIANSRVYVLDDHRRPAAPGSRGEVYIGGAGLAHGYLHRPEQTAAAFIPDPISERPTARLYRTGDIARQLPDGNLEFLGRADSQVKIRGFRVELGEIEASLDACPGVRSAFVTVHGADSAHRRLVAYLVAGDGASPGPAELREFLARRLPEYMLPAAFVFLDRFPLTVNGKIDQRRLPAPRFGTTGQAAGYVPPRNDTERMIAEDMARILGADRVGLDDSFFALGGYSLLAAELVRTVRKRFAAELALADFYQQPTVAGLADQVSASRTPVPGRRRQDDPR